MSPTASPRRLSLLQIVAGLDPRHGGPSYYIPRLCDALADWAADSRILTVCEAGAPKDPPIKAFPQDFGTTPVLRSLRLSSNLAVEARRAAPTADLVHVHGLWLMPNVYAARAARAARRPLIVSPHGMLSPGALAFSRRKKALLWRLLQGPAYADAACWHATSELEVKELREFGIRGPIALVPYGIDLPVQRSPERRGGMSRTILFLGRLHPKKGLDRLIEAWPSVAAQRPDWQLRIVGPDEEGHRAAMEARAAELRAPRLIFDGPLFGKERDAAFDDADLFVLPTRSENFGIAVAEALAAGVPAIVSKGGPWSGLESERCGWWIEQGVEPLVDSLLTATALSDSERFAMGARGHEWISREFGWAGIAGRMVELYRWVAGLGGCPAFVKTE